MVKYFGIGIFITVIAGFLGFLSKDWNVFIRTAGLAGFSTLLFAGLLAGAYTHGNQNSNDSRTEVHIERDLWIKRCLVISIPNVVILMIFLLLF